MNDVRALAMPTRPDWESEESEQRPERNDQATRVDDHNAHFQWVANPNKIIAAVKRGHKVLDHSG